MFLKIKEIGDEIVKIIDPATSLTAVALFKSVVIAWFTLYVMFVGFSFVWGKTNTPIRDITEKFIIFSVIGAFAFNIGTWYTSAITIINELSTWASQGDVNNLFSRLETGTLHLNTLSQAYIKNDKSYIYHFEALFGTILVYIAYYAFGLVSSIMLIFNMISLKLLVFTFPLAVVALFFPPIKDMFAKWVQLLVTNTLSLLFITVFFNSIYTLVMKEIIKIIGKKGEIIITTSAFEIAAYLIVGIFLFKMAVSLAESMTSASLERIAGTAARGTAAGAAGAGYVGAKAASATGRGAVSALTGRAGSGGGSGGGGGGTGLRKTVGGGGAVGVSKSVAKGAHSIYQKAVAAKKESASAMSAKARGGGLGLQSRSTTAGGSGSSKGGSNGAFSGSSSKSKPSSGSQKSKKSGSSKYAKIGAINKYKKAKEGE